METIKTTFLILGGYGYTGKLLAHLLLEWSEARLVISGRNLDKAQAFSDELNRDFSGERVSALRTDAADIKSLRHSFTGVDMVIVAAPTTQYTQNVVRAAIAAGTDYLDVQYSNEKLKILNTHADQVRAAGRCFMTEAGYHPGLIAALIRYAARNFIRLESAHVGGLLNMGRALPYSDAVDELMEAFKSYQAQIFKDGSWTKAGTFSTHKFDFGEPYGVRNAFSMYFDELSIIPRLYPGIQEVGFYIAETHWITDYVISMLVMAGLKLFPRATKPLGKLMWWGMQTFPRPPYGVTLQAVVRGAREDGPAAAKTSIFHPDGYFLTAAPVAACLLQYLDGSARRPGLWMMGEIADPVYLMEDMKSMGVKISET